MRAVSTLLCVAMIAGVPHLARAGSRTGPPGGSSSGSPPSSGPIAVDVAESAGDVEVMRRWMLDTAAKGMADAGVAADEVRPGRELVVQVEGVVFDYQYTVGVRTASGWLGATQSMACSCDDDELTASVRAAVTNVAPRLKGDPPGPAGPTDDRPTARPLGPKGIAGAVLLGVGVGGMVSGAVLLARGEDRTTRSDDLQRYEGTTTRPAGIGLLAVGGAAVITGAVLLGLALTSGKRSSGKRSAGKSAVAWRPAFGSRFVGVAVGGKF